MRMARLKNDPKHVSKRYSIFFNLYIFNSKIKTLFWGMVYLFWVWNQNGGGT